MREILIDTREFEPPAPMQMVLSELQNMIANESFIHQIHRLEPNMVINRIKPMGIDYIIKKEKDIFHIYYFYPQDRQKILEQIDV
jgi:formate-dependent phosphoribosylglycinamide formyltransferase (GAR transformylase)